MRVQVIGERCGVLGAKNTMVQCDKIQEESMVYSVFDQGRTKHDGSLPLIDVNIFLSAFGWGLHRRREEPADRQREVLRRGA